MNRKSIPISQVKRAEIRHEQLPLSLMARIYYLQDALDEVYPQSLDKWVDGFRRDSTPESEVEWWERLTRCYRAYTEPKDLSFKQKQAAFKVLFTLGMGSDLKTVGPELDCLPSGAREEVLALMGGGIQ